ncbi:hypothetical protein [Streptosporangium longisporum]|uniref:Uncharacterized protein n=1 Tax=Streptosporangium longisporum TaxID=46187 RepID=A0ABP6KEU0_9ACTN
MITEESGRVDDAEPIRRSESAPEAFAVWLRDDFFGRDGEPAFRKGAVWRTALLSSVIVDRPGQRG